MISRRARNWIIALAIGGLILVIGLAVLKTSHFKHIKSGEFEGLRIGDTKIETLARIKLRADVRSISFKTTQTGLYSVRNIENIDRLVLDGLVNLNSFSLFGGWADIEISQGIVVRLEGNRRRLMRPFHSGQSSEEVKEALIKVLQSSDQTFLHVGRDYETQEVLSDIFDNSQIVQDSDRWLFRLSISRFMELIFVNGYLTDIFYINNFGETP